MCHFGEFLVSKGNNFSLNIELLSVVEFFFLTLFDPVIDWPDFRVFLNDGYSDKVLHRLIFSVILSDYDDTFLIGSTSLSGKSPPVRLRTSLSVTSDLRLKGSVVLVGT